MSIKEMLLKKLEQQNYNVADFINSKEIQEPEIKTCKIEIRVTEEEKDLLKTMAKLKRTSVSELVRQVMLNEYLNKILKL